MTEGLIHNMNARIGARDTVVHVGDFLCKGNEKGSPGMPGIRFHDMVDRLTGRWCFVLGNHDQANGVRHACSSMVVKVGPRIAWVQHKPLSGLANEEAARNCDLVICGHVHEKWKTCKIDGVIHINVGVDSSRYMPLRDDEVLGLFDQETRRGPTCRSS